MPIDPPTHKSTEVPGEIIIRGRPLHAHRFNGTARLQGLLWELYDRGDARDRVLLGKYRVYLIDDAGRQVFPPEIDLIQEAAEGPRIRGGS